MKLKIITTLIIAISSLQIMASNLRVSDAKFSDDSSSVSVDISWDNAWKNQRNHDAVWLFAKADRGKQEMHHWKLNAGDLSITSSNTDINLEVATDQVGAFLSIRNEYRGNISLTLKLSLRNNDLNEVPLKDIRSIRIFGIEMVYIPEGGFTLGEPGDEVLKYGGLFNSDDNGQPKGLFKVTAADQVIPIGPKKDHLYYLTETGYEGDQQGTIPAEFPNGYGAFYIMKYEPTQGQYVDFLNTLSEQQSHHRANFGGKTYYDRRGTIRIDNNVYVADSPERPCNYLSWDDAMAYADWAGLRPITELEFVKAARGPEEPITNQYPWGTNSYEQMKRAMQEDGNIKMENGWDESRLSDETKVQFGASYYWVMDLAGSMWERVISIGDEKGRSFTGVHGDGTLNSYGFADVDDWPYGVKSKGGFGFRGGGYYVYPMNFSAFNPYSPVAYRRYGGWPGGNRKEAYGARFGRTAGE